MASRILASASLLLGLSLANADTADDYYHRGAKHYIFGEKQKAVLEVDSGRRQYPDDPKLNQLASLLAKEDQQKQQPQQDQNEQQKDEKQKEEQKQDKQKQDEQQAQQEKPEESRQDQEQQSAQSPDDKQKEDQQRQAQQNQPGQQDEKQPESEDGQAVMARMTPQQAIQLLESFKTEERTMIFTPPKTNRQDRIFKDW
jgi:hypothetical protein